MADDSSGPPANPDAAGLLEHFGFTAADTWLEHLRMAEVAPPFGRIGPYELLEEISRGGQGIVYRAVQPNTGRIVALKRLLAGSLATNAMRRRFEREVEALTTVDHPNIVTMLAVDVVDGVPVLAMEWIDGKPVTQWASSNGGGRRSTHEIVRLFTRICNAVHHAHQRGLIHRDIKPSNVLVDAHDSPYVLDFGVAKLTQPDDSSALSTISRDFVGTLAYASPEQVAGRPADVDIRSDVYSLGVLLFELLTERLPYELGDGLAVAIRTIEQVEPIRPTSLDRRIDRDLEAVMLKALAKDRTNRYQSVDALVADLSAWQAGEPVSARRPNAATQWHRFLRRHRLGVAFAATVFTLLCLFAVVTTILAFQIADERDGALTAQAREEVARKRAEAQAARAESISEFLQEVLASSDPLRRTQPDLSVRESLDVAARRVETALAPTDRPVIRAVIGRAYGNLGLFQQAEDQLRAAVAEFRESGAEGNPDLVEALIDLSGLLHVDGRHEVAGTIMNEALEAYRALLADGVDMAGVDLTGLAGPLVMRGDYAQAESLYREALAADMARFGEQHPVVADDLMGLASLLAHIDKNEEAVALGQQALTLRRELLGDGHADVATDLYNLASIYHNTGQPELAEETIRAAISLRREVLGDGHPTVAHATYQLGTLLLTMDRLDDAAETFREARELHLALYGEEHHFVAVCAARYGQTLNQLGDYEAAEPELRDALATMRAALPADSFLIPRTQSELALSLAGQGRFEEAEPLQLDSHEAQLAHYGIEHKRTQTTIRRLVDLYDQWGRPQEADQWRAKLRE